jgi:hypothetical protein
MATIEVRVWLGAPGTETTIKIDIDALSVEDRMLLAGRFRGKSSPLAVCSLSSGLKRPITVSAPTVDALLAAIRADNAQHAERAAQAAANLKALDAPLKELKVGDRVQFTPDARPKYLLGIGGVVADKAGTRLYVDVDEDPRAGRFSGARSLSCPSSILRAAPDLPQIAHLFRIVQEERNDSS